MRAKIVCNPDRSCVQVFALPGPDSRYEVGGGLMTLTDFAFVPTNGSEDRSLSIRDQLRDAIIDRRLAPGTKLNEAEVGELFSVSRTVVRSALQMLSFEGLVRTERNRGAFVANPT